MMEQTSFAPILRPRLIERLAACARHPIALIIAPAGYGKSVVLRQYLTTLTQPTVRFALRVEHSTLLSFVRGFAETLREAAPHAITSLAGAYERNQSSTKRAADLARWLHAHLELFAGVIAIDDLHLADGDPEVARFLTSLIERSKDRISWILASRSSMGLPAGTWLAYRDADLPVDEHDLRFTHEEARTAARDLGVTIRDEELKELLELTEGWPAAMSFALRTSTRSAELRNISAVTREMIYRFLAEQVYDGLDEDERGLLEVAMALPIIDVDVLERAGFDRAFQLVERLRERTAFIYEESPRLYQCHELFREFLRHEVALGGKRSQQAVQERAARALEASGDVEHAIAAYAAAGAQLDVLRLLEHHGFDLLERARSDVVGRAIDGLDEKMRRENATVLALNGALHATAGKFTRAESLFRRALTRAGNDRDLIATTSLRLATLIANQGGDVAELLRPVISDEALSASDRAEALSLVAGQLAVTGDSERAREAVTGVDLMLRDVESDAVMARILHRVGIACHHLGLADKAIDVLVRSAELATESHLYALASRANAVLSNVVLHERDDVDEQFYYAERACEAALKAGDALAMQTALLQMLSAEMRRGDVERSIALERRLSAVIPSELVSRYLAIFRASRLAWEGRFSEAQQLLSPCWNKMPYTFDRATCGSEYALFLALDGQPEESARVLREVLPPLDLSAFTGLFRVRSVAVARCFCILVEATNGRMTFAERTLQSLDAGDDEVIWQLKRLVGGILRRADDLTEEGGSRVRRMLDDLAAAGYADVARLMSAVDATLATREAEDRGAGGLTPAELDVLRLLDQGLIPKQIAAQKRRSVNTVRVHIANAIAKLGCHGHVEAIRTARRLKLI